MTLSLMENNIYTASILILSWINWNFKILNFISHTTYI